jgi:hypothetical protein
MRHPLTATLFQQRPQHRIGGGSGQQYPRDEPDEEYAPDASAVVESLGTSTSLGKQTFLDATPITKEKMIAA